MGAKTLPRPAHPGRTASWRRVLTKDYEWGNPRAMESSWGPAPLKKDNLPRQKGEVRALTSWGAVACCDLAVRGDFLREIVSSGGGVNPGSSGGCGRARCRSFMSSENFCSFLLVNRHYWRIAQGPALYSVLYCLQSALSHSLLWIARRCVLIGLQWKLLTKHLLYTVELRRVPATSTMNFSVLVITGHI